MSDFNTQLIEEFRANKGKVGGMFEGKDLLILHTVGRTSGKEQVVPLRHFVFDGKHIVVGSAGGADNHPSWYLNVLASLEVNIELGTETRSFRAEQIGEPERSALWERVVGEDPGFGEYPKKTSRIIPLLSLNPVS